jgi:serine/threonine protein kinase
MSQPEPFGAFDLLSLLAKGGMAELFMARHRGSGQLVVVKRLLPELEERPDVVDLFLTEADIGRLMKHENVVQVLDAGEVDGKYFLVMEFVDGLDVEGLLSFAWKTHSPVPPPLVMRIGIDAARGLDSAHKLKSPQGTEFGLVHRDVSPDNIFVTATGVPKMADFGIAKLASIEGVTTTGLLKGKLTYMAPEQVKGVPLDGRADEFALALILYEMLSGNRPFAQREGESELEAFNRVQKGKVEALHKVDEDLPRPICRVIDQALRGWRWRRHKDCAAFADKLEAAAASVGMLGTREQLAAHVQAVKAAAS